MDELEIYKQIYSDSHPHAKKIKESMPLREMAFLVKKRHQRKFQLEVRTREQCHAHEPAHAHLWHDCSCVSVFITEEIPQSTSDLRYENDKELKYFGSDVLNDFVDWANESTVPQQDLPKNWDRLKDFYETLQNTDNPIKFARISDLK